MQVPVFGQAAGIREALLAVEACEGLLNLRMAAHVVHHALLAIECSLAVCAVECTRIIVHVRVAHLGLVVFQPNFVRLNAVVSYLLLHFNRLRCGFNNTYRFDT